MFYEGLNDTQLEIIRWTDKLDQFVIAKEATWGIGALQTMCSAATAEKIERQNKKLADAVKAQDIRAVQDLVNGFIKGYEIMEKEAIERGFKPIFPECMEFQNKETGFVLRISKNVVEARNLHAEGVYVWSLSEIARVIENEYTLVNRIKNVFPEGEVKAVKNKTAFKEDSIEGVF